MEKANAGVANELTGAHEILLKDLRELKEATDLKAGADVAKLRSRLSAIQAHIAKHFQFEEQNGYLDAVAKQEPRLERAILRLADEHRQLAQTLQGLIDRAMHRASLDASFGKEVRAWIDQVRQHERSENDLVQDAFNVDLGPED